MNAIIAAILKALRAKPVVAVRKAVHTGPSSAPWDIPDVAEIKSSEALRLDAYLDGGGVWTIGWGHTGTARKGMRIKLLEAQRLFENDLAWVKRCLDSAVKVPLSPNQVEPLYSFIFNVGAGAFRSSTMLRKLNKGDYAGAANEFKRWNKDNGETIRGLTLRRAREAKQFRKG